MNTNPEVEPTYFAPIPTRRVLASNLGEAGRAVVRASSSSSRALPAVIPYELRAASDAVLASIDKAQMIGLETGNCVFTDTAGR